MLGEQRDRSQASEERKGLEKADCYAAHSQSFPPL